MEEKYFVVEAWEVQQTELTKKVHVRIHKGTADGLGRFWEAWNEKNRPAYRMDRVVAVRETQPAACRELRRHLDRRRETF